MKKTDITFSAEIEYGFEAYQLLGAISPENPQEIAKFRKEIYERFGEKNDYVKRCIDWLEMVIAQGKKEFGPNLARIRFFFEEMENTIIPANLLLDALWNERDKTKSVAVLREFYKQLDFFEKDAYFLSRLDNSMTKEEFWAFLGNPIHGVEVPECVRVHNIFSYIHEMDVTLETKDRIMDLYLNRDAYVEEIFAWMERAEELLYQYDSVNRELVETWSTYWSGIIAEERFAEVMEKFSLNESLFGEHCYVGVSLVQCATLFLHIDGEFIAREKPLDPMFRIGLVLSEEYSLKNGEQNSISLEHIQTALKLLSDKSKLEILLFVKERPAYGSEIASHFELTTATVSHHMNKLMQQGLVSVRQQENRIYYQADQEELVKIFENCKKLFE